MKKLMLLLVTTLLLQVNTLPAAAHPTAQAEASEQLAVILILDDSGSMETNDPNDLRYTGAQMFISLLDANDAAGALRFASGSSPLTNGLELIGSAAQQAALVERLAPAAPHGYTDVKAAFETARAMRAEFRQAGYRMVVVFLTDGKPEIPAPYPAYEQEALAAARSLDAPVLAIALTPGGQTAFLSRLAAETGGSVILARSAADLLDAYLQILGELKDRTVIGTGVSAAPGEATISLDPALAPYLERASFITGLAGTAQALLLGPGGQPAPYEDGDTLAKGSESLAHAFTNPRFQVISVPQPAGGEWRFTFSGSGAVQARAILYSRLRGQLVSPQHQFEAGQPLALVVRLVEENHGGPAVALIGQASFAAWITRPDGAQDSLDQFFDDGTHGDAQAGDGLYTREYTHTGQPGVYQVTFRASKGAIPVRFQAQLQAVALPRLALDQPALPAYDIRSQPVPVTFHLEGMDLNALDRGGFTADITTPGGHVHPVALTCQAGACSGAYLPDQDGLHHLSITPQGAVYQGLPYRHSLAAAFTARIIPTVTVRSVQIGLPGSQAAGVRPRFELTQARAGIPLLVSFHSSSPRSELLLARVEDLPGFTLQGDGEQSLSVPTGESTLSLHLAAGPALVDDSKSKGDWALRGRLIFTPAGESGLHSGFDLLGSAVPLELGLYQPALSLSPEVISSVSPQTCYRWLPLQIRLRSASTSARSETIDLRLEGIPSAALDVEHITVHPGSSETMLTIRPAPAFTQAGSHTARLVVSGQRDGVLLNNGSSYPLTYRVDPVWVTCRQPMLYTGAGLGAAVFIAAALAARAWRANQPPLVSGTLVHWQRGAPALAVTASLAALNKPAVMLGAGSQCDIVIPAGDGPNNVQNEHALIVADRAEGGDVHLILRPIAPILHGYRKTSADIPLEEDVIYQMGDRLFKLIRDL